MNDVVLDPVIGAQLLSNDDVISFDLETTGLSPWKDNIALMQFHGHTTQTPVVVRVADGVVPEAIKALFASGHRQYVGHNVGGFDVLFLDTHGVNWKCNTWFDTLIGEGMISTTGRRDVSRNLKNSVRRRLGLTLDKDIEHGKWTAEVLSEAQMTYAVNDVLYLYDLMKEQVLKADSQGQTKAIEMEMQLVPITAQMTLNGLPLLPEVLNAWLDEQRELEVVSHDWLNEHLGSINYASPIQIMKAVKSLGLEFENTRAETLAELANYGEGLGSEVAKHMLDYRAPAQRIKMYQQSWQDRYICDNWVHARFWQTGTDTLRYSSSDPNLQQVPKDGRKIIGNLDGIEIVNADYSQIEVRIAAEIANDENLKNLLDSGDVHRNIAAQIFQVPAGEVTDEQRKMAKACTFTLLFGGGANGLYQYARNSGASLSQEEAMDIFSGFFTAFQGLRRVREQAQGLARNRHVVTIQLPNSAKRVLVGSNVTPNRILNTAVQGSAAVGLKYAMIEADKAGLMKYIGATVHDELVAAVPTTEAVEYGHELEQAMIRGMQVIFPNMITKVEVKQGKCWQR